MRIVAFYLAVLIGSSSVAFCQDYADQALLLSPKSFAPVSMSFSKTEWEGFRNKEPRVRLLLLQKACFYAGLRQQLGPQETASIVGEFDAALHAQKEEEGVLYLTLLDHIPTTSLLPLERKLIQLYQTSFRASPRHRYLILKLLSKMQSGERFVEEALLSENEQDRFAAAMILALQHRSRKEILPILIGNLEKFETRVAVVQALGSMGPDALEAVSVLQAELTRERSLNTVSEYSVLLERAIRTINQSVKASL